MKKANIIEGSALYLILVILFFSLMLLFIQNQKSGASVWAEYYSKELSRVVNFAKPGDAVIFDVQTAIEIAKDNEVPFNEVFDFNNADNEICVKLSKGRKTCYYFFNEIDVVNWRIEPDLGKEINLLKFEIREARK